MVVFGTRPEAIKMAPVVAALRKLPSIETTVVVTAQHRQMLDQVLDLFDIVPDEDLDAMEPDQDLPTLFSKVLVGVSEVISRRNPDLVLVHGDTSTTFAAALASFYTRTAVGHVEAGLRTRDMCAPWPEEGNRRLTAPLAALHFAPTEGARRNLLAEGIDSASIHVTGNTVVDALLDVVRRLKADPALQRSIAARFPFLDQSKRLILVTGHRRENFGAGFEQICYALKDLARREDVQLVYPVHLNPNVQGPVNKILASAKNVFLVEPQEYLPFVYLMTRSELIITDSGGIQEEAPSLGKPVLVMRGTTERPEMIESGGVVLVGADRQRIVEATRYLLDCPDRSQQMRSAHNPHGDGNAAERVARAIARFTSDHI